MTAHKKYLDLSLLVLAFLVWFLFELLIGFFWDLFALPVLVDWPVGYPHIIAFVFALVFYVGIKRQKSVGIFGLEVISELSKVTWPTQKETLVSTGVIIVMLAIASILLFLMDTVWGTLTRSFLEF
ncbi:MAG: preprotein translocase subunit SecE [Deltaproteobacteria bacterium]|nr:preprotein translocase subunit SecE [Deltaproteobacteria bacterium]